MSGERERLVLVVSRSPGNIRLLRETLQRAGYPTAEATSIEELDQRLTAGTGEIGLALVDVAGFDRRLWARLEQLKRQGVPFIVIAPGRAPAVSARVAPGGASAVLFKPVTRRALTELVRQLLGGRQA